MKYIVEVKYTNPAHEHVSLRRRVETVRRIVEAVSEAEAINRVTRQQRSLGFTIKEAEVVHNGGEGGAIITNNEPKKKKIVGDEGETEIKKEPVKEETVEEDRAMSAAIAGGSVGSKILTGKIDPNFGYAANKMPPHLKAAQAKSDALSKVVKRPQAGTLAAKKANEEVEQIDERNMENKEKKNAMATKLGVSTVVHGKSVGVDPADHQPSFKADPEGFKIRGRSVMNDPKVTSGQVTALKKANEEVEEVDEARKMSRVEWRIGTESEVDKNNKKIFDRLSKTDPVKAAAFHANLLRMKKKDVKEAVEDKKANKGRKAAERMINLAKSKKNQVNLEPSVDPYKHHQPTTGK